MRSAHVLVLVPLVLLGLPARAAAQGDVAETPPVRPALSPEDVFELEWADDPRIAPDGSRIVYVRSAFDVMTDGTRRRLWTVDTDGTGHRPLGGDGDDQRMPRWSPSGDRLVWVSREDGRPVVRMHWTDRGVTATVARLETAPSGLSWSPDGTQLAFRRRVLEEPERLVDEPRPPEGATWSEPPRVVQRTIWRADGEGLLPPGYDHLFVVPAGGGTPRRLTSGPYDHGDPAWTADGRALIVSANRRDDADLEPLDTDLHRVDVETGAIARLTTRYGPDDAPAASPDGRHLAWLGFDDRHQGYQITRLRVGDAEAGSPRDLLPELDRDVESFRWTADGRALVVRFTDHGVTRLARTGLDGSFETLPGVVVGGTSMGRPYGSGSFSLAEGGAVAYTAGERPDRPADVGRASPGGRSPRRLTALNEDVLGARTLGELSAREVTSSHDGRPVQAWVVTPPDFDRDRRWPLLLEIHGGPFADYGPRWSTEVQLYAAAGYVVVYANPRGSTSYGETFGNLIHHAYPGHDHDDLMSVVDALVAEPWIDPDRLVVTGGSGGGVLSAWIVGKTDRFAAAVVAKPVINWASFVLTSDASPSFVRYWFPAPPWEDPDHYWARSPLSLVGAVSTPTMLLTGEEDWRTPISESEQYYQALKLRGVETALVRVPGASHGIASRPSRLASKVAHVLAWFDEHAAGEARR